MHCLLCLQVQPGYVIENYTNLIVLHASHFVYARPNNFGVQF